MAGQADVDMDNTRAIEKLTQAVQTINSLLGLKTNKSETPYIVGDMTILVSYKGEWKPSVSYIANDVVSYGDGWFKCIEDCIDEPPPSSKWANYAITDGQKRLLNLFTESNSSLMGLISGKASAEELSKLSDDVEQLTTKSNELDTTKADKSELPYSLVVKEIENGTVSLDDRADNYVDARALGSSDSLDIDFPVLVDGRSRDFVLAVECGENPPTISYAAFATIMAEDASTLATEPGMNIYAFTEFKNNMFLAARKTVDTVVVNTPESSDQVLLAMQKRGIDTTDITDFGGVAETLGLGDTDTPQDAIDMVMN